MRNIKQIGNDFEKEVCAMLAQNGYWVHFIVPDARGAQPFDIIAVKGGKALAIDCKTCVANSFNISRLEDNQIMAFNRWMKCGNPVPIIAVKHNDLIYKIKYNELQERKSIKLTGEYIWEF